MSILVIVESPAKAKTIEKFLPDEYVVRASMGHIRDLPDNASQLPEKYRKEEWASLGVNVEEDFDAVYVVKDPRSKKSLTELRKELKGADELILATDEDREGEAISWHLREALKPKVPVKRMVFHEITKSAIESALKATREIDANLVEAQEARRILDRLVGYPLSLLVAKKIKYGLSAGRVQSPAVRLIVERERERRRFRVGTYWDLTAQLDQNSALFSAALLEVDGTRVATGKDFDESTGQVVAGKDVVLLSEADAKLLSDGLQGKTPKVTSVSERAFKSSPKPPFTTSTLQQEASRKLSLSASQTMSLAQRLYENGHITYMRTDSTNLSDQAVEASRKAIVELYGGGDYLPKSPRRYASKQKGAQEAHEAIRPTGDSFKHPSKTGLSGKEAALYDLIWKRTVASQMADAQKTSIRVDLSVEVEGKALTLRANGNRIDFPGFMRAYVEGSDDPDAALDDQEVLLPPLKEGDTPTCTSVEAKFHETKPPARFTEASLVRKLEEEGIGRPSTYATIINKISDGRFGRKQGRTIIPTFLAFAVADFLDAHFPDLVDLNFTARMEDDLDDIASGNKTKVDYLHDFYRRDGAFADQVRTGETTIDPPTVRIVDLGDDTLDATVRVGPYGAYAEFEDGSKVNIPDDIAPADLTNDDLAKYRELREKGPEVLGEHPETGQPIYLMTGRFGTYLQLGDREEGSKKKPQTGSIPKSWNADELTLEQAVKALSLPRKLGKHEDGKQIEAAIGRFGPYVKHDKEYRSLDSEEDAFTVTLEQALELLSQPKKRRAASRQKTLKELGEHPDGDTMVVLDGRFGPYIKAGKTNASLPKGTNVEQLTTELAIEIVDAKRAK